MDCGNECLRAENRFVGGFGSGCLCCPVGTPGESVGFSVEAGGAIFDYVFVVVYVGRPTGVAGSEGVGVLKVL